MEELDELTALVGDVVELARGAGPAEQADEVRLDEVAAGGGASAPGGAAACSFELERGADDRERPGRPDRPGGVEPGGQRAQVEPRGRHGGGRR